MTFRRPKKVNSNHPQGGPSTQDNDIYFSSSKSDSCKTVELQPNSSEVYNYKTLAYSGGTLPRTRGGGLQKWKPLAQSPEPQRKVVVLEKKEDESFGFEIQTYGLHHQDQNLVEMCTFVCKVHDNSPAQQAGLKVGDTLSSVNEASVDGFRHKDIVQLIRACGNSIRLETVYSDSIRKAELEARLQYLKQTLHEKWDEFRSLMVQEQRLVHGIVLSDAAVYESLESAGIYGSLGAPSPAALRAVRCTGGSTSSSASVLSTDEPLYQTCLYQAERTGNGTGNGTGTAAVSSDHQQKKKEEPQPPPPQRKLRPASQLFSTAKTQLTRSASTRSYVREPSSITATSTTTTTTTSGEKQSGFGRGSLQQRKPKQKSFRRRLLKFIPGLNLPLEEEESKL
ncbi:unnamed protein product [Lota lota]